MKCLVLVACCVLLGSLTGVDGACTDYTTCFDCTAQITSGCTWCGSTNACQLVNPFGDNGCTNTISMKSECPGAVRCSTFSLNSTAAATTAPGPGLTNAPAATGCDACLAHSGDGCRYCGGTDKCQTVLEMAGCSSVRLTAASCSPDATCGAHKDCETCASAGCSWCKSTNVCDSSLRTLGCTDSALVYAQCANATLPPVPALPPIPGSSSTCTSLTSCTTCAEKFASDTCTWCNATQKCDTAIASLGCSSPAMTNLQCTIFTGGDCNTHTDCTSCATPGTACSWCNATNTCQGLTASCATTGFVSHLQCPGEMLSDLPSEGDCNALNGDCASCVAKMGCSYCNSNLGKCELVTSNTCPSAADIKATAQQCTALTLCPSRTSCKTCTTDVGDGCAWCSATNQCQLNTDSCAQSTTMFAAECSGAKAACQAATKCSTCLAEATGCAWCNNGCDLNINQATCSGVVAIASTCPTSAATTAASTTAAATTASTNAGTITSTTTTAESGSVNFGDPSGSGASNSSPAGMAALLMLAATMLM